MKHRNLIVAWVFWEVILSFVASLDPAEIGAQSPNHVGLVVRFGDGSVVTRCVEFAEEEISGYEVLMRSGLQVVASQAGGTGVTICEIEGVGCPANNCFCRCSGSTCTYWSYWHFVGGEWSYASVGASGRHVRSGDVEGWVWGQGVPPPVVPLEQICAPSPAATLLPLTPLPTDTATVLPTATAHVPTRTAQPTDTATTLPTATWTPGSILSTQPPPPSATPTNAATPSATLMPQGVAGQGATPSITSTVSIQDGRAWSNYILFGVLLAVLMGVIVVMVVRRRRGPAET